MLYKNRTIKELDSYYGINESTFRKETYKINDCKKIQQAFKEGNIELTLAECRVLYETYSDERWCAGWENGLEDMDTSIIFKTLLPFFINIVNDRVDRINQVSEQLVAGNYVNPRED